MTTFRKRRFSRRMSQRLWLEGARFAAVYRLLSGLRATPCVWIGTDAEGYGPLTVYGFYRDFSIDIAYSGAELRQRVHSHARNMPIQAFVKHGVHPDRTHDGLAWVVVAAAFAKVVSA